MAVLRATPYPPSNFLVECNRLGNGQGPEAGFQEVSGLGLAVEVSEYRAGSDATSRPRHVPGLPQTGRVTLRRGAIGSLDMAQWMLDVVNGSADIRSDVTIRLLDEARHPVMTWVLRGAFAVAYQAPVLNALDANGIAYEELTLAFDELQVE